jgi:probable phosphoglycerate mutase
LRPGEADGMTVAEFKARFGIPDFSQEPFRSLAPGGESWAQFMLRVGGALDRIIREHRGQTVVIVCHGGVVDGSFVYFIGLSSQALPPISFHTHNTSITHWQHRLDEDHLRRWRLMRYNDDTHLHGLGAEMPIAWRGVEAAEEAEHPSVPTQADKPNSA